jgi:hypothetical protein
VAAFVGLLAALVAGGAPGAQADPALVGAAGSALVVDSTTLASPALSVVGDALRSTHPAIARTVTTDRSPVAHVGGAAVVPLALLLAVLALALAARCSSWPSRLATWCRSTAPRAPPALAAC